jgi:hypothetical protein
MNQFGDVVGQSFLHRIALVIFYRMNTDSQLSGDHFAAQSVVTKPDDFQFSGR